MGSPVQKALIIGGGVAGLAAALALQRVGIASVVYEANETDRWDHSAFLTVARNGVSALQTLDALTTVQARGFWVARMELYSGTGKRLGVMGSNAAGIAIERGQLVAALRDEVLARKIAVQTGKRLLNAQITAAGVVAHFADGTQAQGDLLIGADGIHSSVRKMLDVHAPKPRYAGLVGLGGVVVSGSDRRPDTFTFVFGKHAFFGWISNPDGATYWFANVPYAQEPDRQALKTISPHEWKQRLSTLFAQDVTPAARLIGSTPEQDGFIPTILNDLPVVPVWHQGAIVLIGDAAHATSPSSGQGASLALEDSVILAKFLRDSSDLDQALTAYEAARRPRVAKVAQLAKRTNQSKVAGPLLRRFQDLLFPVALKYFVHSESENWLYQYQMDWEAPPTQALEITS